MNTKKKIRTDVTITKKEKNVNENSVKQKNEKASK